MTQTAIHSHDSFWLGIVVGLVAQAIAVAILIGLGSGLAFFIGIIQLAWIVPLAIVLPRFGKTMALRGMLISGAPSFLAAVVLYGLIALDIVLV